MRRFATSSILYSRGIFLWRMGEQGGVALRGSQFIIENGILYFLDLKQNYQTRAVIPAHESIS